MGINTGTPGYESPEAFTAAQGMTPQERFSQTVRDDADARNLPEAEKNLAAARAAVAAFGDEEAIWAGSDQRKMQDLADAINLAAELTVEVATLKSHKAAALAFLAGKITDYQPYLSSEGQGHYHAGWIDTTLVPA